MQDRQIPPAAQHVRNFPVSSFFPEMNGDAMGGIEADHKRLVAARRREAAKWLVINKDAFAAALAEHSLSTVARNAGVGRRQLYRLRDRVPQRLRRRDVEALAKALKIPVEVLVEPETPSGTAPTVRPHTFLPGGMVAQLRGIGVATRFWRSAGHEAPLPLRIETLFAALLSFDRWSQALYPSGTAVLKERGTPPVRERNRLEKRRGEFAHHMAQALGTLVDGEPQRRGRADFRQLNRANALALAERLESLCRLADHLCDESEPLNMRLAVTQARAREFVLTVLGRARQPLTRKQMVALAQKANISRVEIRTALKSLRSGGEVDVKRGSDESGKRAFFWSAIKQATDERISRPAIVPTVRQKARSSPHRD